MRNYKETAYDLIKKVVGDCTYLTDEEVLAYIGGVIECAEEMEKEQLDDYSEELRKRTMESARNVWTQKGDEDD